MAERALASVPITVLAVLAMALSAQVLWRTQSPPPAAHASALPAPPAYPALRLSSLGEPIAASQWMALYLQAFDNQPGISLPFASLDYRTVSLWLERMLELDPHAQYPLLMASHLYAQVPDEARQRLMLDFVYRQFLAEPDRRWRWLAHSAIVARHRLHDLPLALKYAQAIARHANGPDVPHWAQQMPIFILEEMGETESARILLGGLLASNTLTDPNEVLFLTERLNALEKRNVETSTRLPE